MPNENETLSKDIWTNRLLAIARIIAGISVLVSIALEFYLKTK